MNNNYQINNHYRSYYRSIIHKVKKSNTQFVILTHTVSDVAAFISEIDAMGDIALIIAIPYSKDQGVYDQLSQRYSTISPDLNDLLDGDYLKNLVLQTVNTQKPLMIVEIGGYFSSVLSEIQAAMQGNLLGVIEDTEAGHRKYELLRDRLPCPVLSVARSRLKDAENFLVGTSCIRAANALLEDMHLTINIKDVLVLGYGKIGQGVCQLLREQNKQVMVFDTDPAKRLLALSRGFSIPDKQYALRQSNAIFGASGTQSLNAADLPHIKNNCILFSCSSKRIEFDLKTIKSNYQRSTVCNNIDEYKNNTNRFYLAGDGQPVNFACGKILVGPLISIVHAEMLSAICELLSSKYENKIQEISEDKKFFLAEKWINTFCNIQTGTYCYE